MSECHTVPSVTPDVYLIHLLGTRCRDVGRGPAWRYSDDVASFGTFIRDARQAKGLTQKDLASKLRKSDGSPLSAQYLNDIEHDRRNPPGPDILRQLARHLELSEDQLFLAADRIPEDLREIGLKRPDLLESVRREFRRRTR